MWLVILMVRHYFPHKLLFDRKVSGLCKTFLNNSSANMQLSKTHMSKIVQSGFLGKVLEPLQKTDLHLMLIIFWIFINIKHNIKCLYLFNNCLLEVLVNLTLKD